MAVNAQVILTMLNLKLKVKKIVLALLLGMEMKPQLINNHVN